MTTLEYNSKQTKLNWIDNTTGTIQELFNKSKIFGNGKLTACNILDCVYPTKYLEPLYKALWFKYLEDNPKLVECLKLFKDFKNIDENINIKFNPIKQYIENYDDYYAEVAQFLKHINYI